jgi:hypothetical protein
MKIIFVFGFVILLFSFNLIANVKMDIINLKNGKTLKGQIYKDIPNEYLQLELKDGSIIKIKYTDIESKEVKETDEYISFNESIENNNTLYSNTIRNFAPKGFDICLNSFNLDYAEKVKLPLKSTESGLIHGINLSLTSNKNNSFWVNLIFDHSWAEEDYIGSSQTGEPRTAKTNSYFFRFNPNLGYTILSSETIIIAPYIGYDMRYWDREIKGNGGIQEIYSWQNIITGLRLDFPISKKINVGFLAQLNIMKSGKITILFSDYDPRYPDVVLNLGNQNAIEFNLPINYSITDKISLHICPYYEKYEFNQSNSYYENGEEILYEPSSTTYLIGVKSGFSIIF